jgi:hypothetical protein
MSAGRRRSGGLRGVDGGRCLSELCSTDSKHRPSCFVLLRIASASGRIYPVFFLSIAGRISISRADPDISGELTIVAAFTRHRVRLKHNSFQRNCLVGDMNLVSFLSLSFASEGFALHQHTFDSA